MNAAKKDLAKRNAIASLNWGNIYPKSSYKIPLSLYNRSLNCCLFKNPTVCRIQIFIETNKIDETKCIHTLERELEGRLQMTLSWDWNGIMGRFCYKTMTCIDIEILMVNIKFQLVLSYSYCKKWKDVNAPPLRLILQYSTQSYLIVVWRFSIIIYHFFLHLCNVIIYNVYV